MAYYQISERYAFIASDDSELDTIVADGFNKPGTVCLVEGGSGLTKKVLGSDGSTWYEFDGVIG
jgi:hypothetical protein